MGPAHGMSESGPQSTFASIAPGGLPTALLPKNAESPRPKKVSDKPETTCSAPSTTENTPWINANAAGTIIATSKASQGFSVFRATRNPVTAPSAIIPSTPRFKTPAFSEMSSPMHARYKRAPNETVVLSIPIMDASFMLNRLSSHV